MDFRTSGKKGSREREGIRDKTSAAGVVNGFPDQTVNNQPLGEWRLEGHGVCQVEGGKDKVPGLDSLHIA